MSQQPSHDHPYLHHISGLELAIIIGTLLLVLMVFGSIALAYDVIDANDAVTVTSSVPTTPPVN